MGWDYTECNIMYVVLLFSCNCILVFPLLLTLLPPPPCPSPPLPPPPHPHQPTAALFLLHCTFFLCSCLFFETSPLFLLPAFQSELRHGPFYYMKQPALTTDPVDVVPQDGRNDFYCWLCHREGQVLCCELCPRVYHAKCLKLPAEPEGDWFCPECEVSR